MKWLWSMLCQDFDGVAVEDADDGVGESGGEGKRFRPRSTHRDSKDYADAMVVDQGCVSEVLVDRDVPDGSSRRFSRRRSSHHATT
jgi:hypothetical protein